MSTTIYTQGSATVTVAAGESVAVYAPNQASVYLLGTYPNYPDTEALIGTVLDGGQTTFGPYADGATLRIDNGAGNALYAVGVAPVITELRASQYQGDPVAVNVTGAVSALAIQGGIVTSTTAAAVAGTVPTGTVMDAAVQMAVVDSIDWAVINTGPNTFTVTADTDHTLVGAGAVATATSGLFRTRKTAANTFVTYRIG